MGVWIASGGLLAAWCLYVLGYARATRPRQPPAGPPTMELAAEPPAVVGLLVTGGELNSDVVEGTLLDLAARRILELHQPGPDPADLLVRVRQPEPDLAGYERRVFDVVAAVAGARLVPWRRVVDAYTEHGASWLRDLRAEVVAAARERGLVRSRRAGPSLVLVALTVAVALSGLVTTQVPGVDPESARGYAVGAGWLCAVPFLTLLLLGLATPPLPTIRFTDAGRRAAGYWWGVAGWLKAHEDNADLPPAAVAVWDRYLAHGVVLGLNPLAARTLSLRPTRAVSFTSWYTGQPRTVRARFPRGPLTYHRAGVHAACWAVALAGCAGFWLLAAVRAATWSPAARWIGYPVAVAVTVLVGYALVRSLVAALFPVTVTGQVLAARRWRPSIEQTPVTWLHVVVDDGRHARTRPWLVRADGTPDIAAGDEVSLRGQSWTRHVHALDVRSRRHPRPVQLTATSDSDAEPD